MKKSFPQDSATYENSNLNCLTWNVHYGAKIKLFENYLIAHICAHETGQTSTFINTER